MNRGGGGGGGKQFDPLRNLIINYLPQSFTKDDIQTMFSRIGPLTNCKLMTNNATGQSLGYGFIEYREAQHAEDAIAQLNGMQVENKRLKVSYARPSAAGDSSNSNLYISGLGQFVDENRLYELFSAFGTIVTHKILKDEQNKSKGVGFVRFATKSDAEKAISDMSGKTLPESDMPLNVKFAIPPAQKVQNMASNTVAPITAILAQQQQQLGGLNPILSANGGTTAALLNQQVAQQVPALQTQQLAGLQGLVGAQQQVQQQNGGLAISPVYVYGLQPTHNELHLYELFSPFGGILNVKLIRDNSLPDKPCKGYAFINFRKQDEALIAITAMNNTTYDGKTLQVSFKSNKGAGQQQQQTQFLGTLPMMGATTQQLTQQQSLLQSQHGLLQQGSLTGQGILGTAGGMMYSGF